MDVLSDSSFPDWSLQLHNSRIDGHRNATAGATNRNVTRSDDSYSLTNLDKCRTSALSFKQTPGMTLPEISEFLREECSRDFHYSAYNFTKHFDLTGTSRDKYTHNNTKTFSDRVSLDSQTSEIEVQSDISSEEKAELFSQDANIDHNKRYQGSVANSYLHNAKDANISDHNADYFDQSLQGYDIEHFPHQEGEISHWGGHLPSSLPNRSQHLDPTWTLSAIMMDEVPKDFPAWRDQEDHIISSQTTENNWNNEPFSVVPVVSYKEKRHKIEDISSHLSNNYLLFSQNKIKQEKRNDIQLQVFQHDAPIWECTNPERVKESLSGEKAASSLLLNRETYPNVQVSNSLLEDIDLSAVDSSCMEQIEQEYQREAIKDIAVACSTKNLDPDPLRWDKKDVENWIYWTIHQCHLPMFDVSALRVSGIELCQMNEEEMLAKVPSGGDIIHSRLHVWRSAWRAANGCMENQSEYVSASPDQTKKPSILMSQPSPLFNITTSKLETICHAGAGSCVSDVKKDIFTSMTPNHTSSIHLWEFLKELLLQPQTYGRFIRWINQERGVFKIEDSGEVARLWGIRKNRPAMNYDKLSRSIRQYYKKGIIKKTAISQRLVYQFVHPIAVSGRT